MNTDTTNDPHVPADRVLRQPRGGLERGRRRHASAPSSPTSPTSSTSVASTSTAARSSIAAGHQGIFDTIYRGQHEPHPPRSASARSPRVACSSTPPRRSRRRSARWPASTRRRCRRCSSSTTGRGRRLRSTTPSSTTERRASSSGHRRGSRARPVAHARAVADHYDPNLSSNGFGGSGMKLASTPHERTIDVDISSDAFWAKTFEERDESFARLRREAPVSWHPPTEFPFPHEEIGFWAVVEQRRHQHRQPPDAALRVAVRRQPRPVPVRPVPGR